MLVVIEILHCFKFSAINFTKRMSIKSPIISFFFIFLFETGFAAFLAPIAKDYATKRYTLGVYLFTPPQPTNLLLDLDAPFTLLDCASWNSAARTGQAVIDSLYLSVTDGRNPGQLRVIPEFVFACSKQSSIKGLVKGAAGSAGLGRSDLSIPAQVSNSSSEVTTFALCLSGSPSARGVAFFGSSGPYDFYPSIDLSKYLNYTPLLNSEHSNGYYIGLTSINVNGKPMPLDDRSLYRVDEKGLGGTKLSTVTPYTKLHTKIFKAFIEAFVKESAALNLTVTEPVKPFGVCYNADDVMSTKVGPAVPTVDLVLQDDGAIWRIFGSNSMVRIFRDDVDVWCLGFLDGGANPKASVVIGGHQM